MYLTLGITLPESIRAPLAELQHSFWTEYWEPVSFLMLPLCIIGTLPSRQAAAELDHALSTLPITPDIPLEPEHFDVFSRNETISLEVRVRSAQLRHLSLKTDTLLKRIGIKPVRPATPLTIPFCKVSQVAPEDISAWMQLHHAFRLPATTVSTLTLFSSWKTEQTVHYTEEESYPTQLHAS